MGSRRFKQSSTVRCQLNLSFLFVWGGGRDCLILACCSLLGHMPIAVFSLEVCAICGQKETAEFWKCYFCQKCALGSFFVSVLGMMTHVTIVTCPLQNIIRHHTVREMVWKAVKWKTKCSVMYSVTRRT